MMKNQPTLYITMGLPASGKTYFTQRLAADLGIFFLNADSVRLAMIDTPTFKPDEHALVYKTVNYIAEAHAEQGLSVLVNGNYHVDNRREAMHQAAKKHGAGLVIIWVEVPIEVARERILARKHEIPSDKMVDPPLEILERMRRAFDHPTPDEPVIKIDGAAKYETQKEQFQTALKNLQ